MKRKKKYSNFIFPQLTVMKPKRYIDEIKRKTKLK